eukprot:3661539-Rhodomonas_salina.1
MSGADMRGAAADVSLTIYETTLDDKVLVAIVIIIIIIILFLFCSGCRVSVTVLARTDTAR